MISLSPFAALALVALTPDRVERVYSGRPGCMCGCRGSYRYSRRHAPADAERGDVNDAQVRKVLATLQANVEHVEADEDCFHADINGRRFVVFVSEVVS